MFAGKTAETANLQDVLTGELIALAQAVRKNGNRDAETDSMMIDGLFVAITNVNFDDESIKDLFKEQNL